MKKQLFFLLLLISAFAQGQTPVPVIRNNGAVTAVDVHLHTKSLKIPVYADTAHATAAMGLDSIGLIFKEFLSSNVWVRDSVLTGGKKWTLLMGGGGGGGFTLSDTGYNRLLASPSLLQKTIDSMKIVNDGHYFQKSDTGYTKTLATPELVKKKTDSLSGIYDGKYILKTDTGYGHTAATPQLVAKKTDSVQALLSALIALKLGRADTVGNSNAATNGHVNKVADSLAALFLKKSDSIKGTDFASRNWLYKVVDSLSALVDTTKIRYYGIGDTTLRANGKFLVSALIRDSGNVQIVVNADSSLTFYGSGAGASDSGFNILRTNLSSQLVPIFKGIAGPVRNILWDTAAINPAAIVTQSSRQKLADSLQAALQAKLNGNGYVKMALTTPSYQTNTQLTADVNQFTSSLQGVVPASGNTPRNQIMANGVWGDYDEQQLGVLDSQTVWSNLLGWSNSSSATVVSGKVVCSGDGTGLFTHSIQSTRYGASMLDNVTETIEIKVGSYSSTATDFFGLVKQSTNDWSAASYAAVFFLNSGGNAGKIAFYTGSGSSYTQQAISTAVTSFVAGDRLSLTLIKDGFGITVISRNVTTNATSDTLNFTYSTVYGVSYFLDNTGTYGVLAGGSPFTLNSWTVSSGVSKNPRLAIGIDSKLQGYYATTQANRAGDILNNSIRSTVNLSGNGDRLREFANRLHEFYVINPQQFIMTMSNDPRYGTDSTTYNTEYDSIATAILAHCPGINLMHGVLYETSVDLSPIQRHILATYGPTKVIDYFTALHQANVLQPDNIHLTDNGNNIIARATLDFPYLNFINRRWGGGGASGGATGSSGSLPFIAGSGFATSPNLNFNTSTKTLLVKDNVEFGNSTTSTGVNVLLTNPNNAANDAQLNLTAKSGTNVTAQLNVIASGTGTAYLAAFNTKTPYSTSNFEAIYMHGGGSNPYLIEELKGGSGVYRGIVLQAGGISNQLYLHTSGNIIIKGSTNNNAALQLPASTITNASAYIPEGTAPTTPAPGHVYAKTSDHNLYWVNSSSVEKCLSCATSPTPPLNLSGNVTADFGTAGYIYSSGGNTITDLFTGSGTQGAGFYFGGGNTLAASSAVTVTNPANVIIGGPPTAGTNVTFSGKSYALDVISGNSFFNGDATIVGHYVSNASHGTSTAGAGAGTSPSVAWTGTDQVGSLSITIGSSPTGSNATIYTFNFGTAFPTGTYVTLTPGNNATAALTGATQVYVTSTTTTFSLVSGASALTNAVTYLWYYHVGSN